MYVDESGNPNYNDGQDIYNLVGVIIQEEKWTEINNAILKLKLEFFPSLPPEDVEFHANAMSQRKGIFSHVDKEKVKGMFVGFFDVISDLPITIISILVNKREILRKEIKFAPIEENAWSYLLERFDQYVLDQNRKNKKNEVGLIIVDSEGERYDQDLREKIRKIIASGTKYHIFKNVIEDILFTYSHWRNLTQISDMVAYCISKYKKSNELFIPCFKKIEGKIRTNPQNQERYEGYGLKIIPRDIKE